jgi:MFS family permease
MSVAFLVGGILADRLPLNLLLSMSKAGMLAAILQLIAVSTVWAGHCFAVTIGIASGLIGAVSWTIWVRYYGRAHLGKIRGSLMTVGVAASSLGPFLMGSAYDLFGGYREILWAFAGLFAPMVGLALLATPPGSRGLAPQTRTPAHPET